MRGIYRNSDFTGIQLVPPLFIIPHVLSVFRLKFSFS